MCDVCALVSLYTQYFLVFGFSAAFSISSESSQVVLIAISSAVAIILLTVLLYVLIGRSVHHSLDSVSNFSVIFSFDPSGS